MLRYAYAIEKRVMGNTAVAALNSERLILLYFSTKWSFCLAFHILPAGIFFMIFLDK